MSNYASLKATINANVKTNGNQEITGAITNSVLNAMVDSMGAGYQFIGVATPTNPGTAQTPDYKCFYLATTPGTYTNLGGLVVADGEVAILKYDSTWHKDVTGAATAAQLTELGQEVKDDYGENEDSSLFLRVVLDKNKRILYGVKQNGDFYFGCGVPQSVKDYILERLRTTDFKLDEETKRAILAESNKVDKEEGKSLINAEFASGVSVVDSNDILDVKTDNDGRILELTKKDGTKYVSGKFGAETIIAKKSILSGAADFEESQSEEYVSVVVDKNGRILSGEKVNGEKYPKGSQYEIPKYVKLLDAMRDGCYTPFLLGSQLVQANNTYDTELGEHNTFKPDKLIKQFNYIGLSGKLPQLKQGRLQTIVIGGVQATILYMGTYVYAITDGNGIVYRMAYSKLPEVTDSNTDIDAISIPLDGMTIDGVYETNDGNFLVEVYDSTSPDTYPTRSLYKVTLDGELNATVSDNPVIVCVPSTVNIVAVREHWSFKQYGSLILISPYGGGRTGQLWLSQDYGNSFECIFNVANETTFVATKPNGQGGYGAYGIHPEGKNMIPAQGDDFWENVSTIGNGSRHIHSCCYDEEFERIWLVMGDDKYLATGIYWSDDMGKTWHRKSLVFNKPDIDMGGTTQMLQVVSMKTCVLFGTDGWGNGIFRYNRGRKDDDVEIELVFGWDESRDNLEGVASHNIVTPDGVMLMVFAADTQSVTPRGGVVASDGYHFRKVFIDTYADGQTLASQKIGWPSFLSLHNEDLYIRTKDKKEIILIESFNK